MCFVYTVQNMNPRLGARKGDRQAISVYDRNIGNRRDIITTPDAAEEFIIHIRSRSSLDHPADLRQVGIGIHTDICSNAIVDTLGLLRQFIQFFCSHATIYEVRNICDRWQSR